MVNVVKEIEDDDIKNCEFFFDNYFTSYDLMEHLSEKGILGTGTVRENRTSRGRSSCIIKKSAKKRRTWKL